MGARTGTRGRRVHTQPGVAGLTGSLALVVLIASWQGARLGSNGQEIGAATALASCLVVAILVAHRFPLQVGPHTKVHLSSVAYYLLAVLLPPPLAGTAAALGSLAGEFSTRKRRGTELTDIVTQAARRVLVVVAAALVARLSVGPIPHVVGFVGAALILGVGDIVTFPLVLGPITGQRSVQIIVAAAHDSFLIEGVQYLIGLVGAMAALQQYWLVALLAPPTALVYLAFQASVRAQDAQRAAEDAQARAEEAYRERAHALDLEQEARRQVERLAAERAATLTQISDGIVVADVRGGITFVNQAARVLHGVTDSTIPLDAFGRAGQLLTMDGQPYAREDFPLARALARGETISDERWRIRRADGTEIVVRGSAAPVRAEDGCLVGAVLTERDVTAEHRVESQKGEFLSAVAHDLRTPLTTIRGRVQYLALKVAGGEVLDRERMRETLERVEASTARMTALIADLLEVANLQIGRPPRLECAPVDLVSVTRDVLRDYDHVVTHHVHLVSTAPSLCGTWDARRLERVLANLLSNAVKYSPNGGEIVVSLREEGRWGVLTVEDHGMGIPSRDLPHVFEQFRRGENAAQTIPGTGIGLAAARAIVEEHGGTVSVTSREGTGSTFTVRLPLHPVADDGTGQSG